MNPPATAGPDRADAGRLARRQLGRVLRVLAVLDGAVLLVVLAMALSWSRVGLSNVSFLAIVVTAAGIALGARLVLAVRLHRSAGDL